MTACFLPRKTASHVSPSHDVGWLVVAADDEVGSKGSVDTETVRIARIDGEHGRVLGQGARSNLRVESTLHTDR
jgi:hypothetical protein